MYTTTGEDTNERRNQECSLCYKENQKLDILSIKRGNDNGKGGGGGNCHHLSTFDEKEEIAYHQNQLKNKEKNSADITAMIGNAIDSSSIEGNTVKVIPAEITPVSGVAVVTSAGAAPPSVIGIGTLQLQTNLISSTMGKDITEEAVAAAAAAARESPFEKLNTLKLLLEKGHLTEVEYKERKNQIINEMTGTSSEIRHPPKTIRSIMKTVVPHSPPDFSSILKERAEKLSFDVDTLEWNSSSVMVKLDYVPFAMGQLRNAYYLQEFNKSEDLDTWRAKPTLFVAKFSINSSEPSAYLSDVEMQAVCAHYAKLYNEHEPPLKVQYARSWILKLKDRDNIVCSVEEYIPGLYVKYSNNNGFVGTETSSMEERERNTPHAFSHFTFVASDFRLMAVDIQGVNDSYTDPQIHTADGRGFGGGNLGTYGIEKFLQTHRCNEVCRWLGLKSLNKQFKPGGTAAPAYQMPHKGIKKSTNPLTQERNTFTRSSTVSEVLGNTEIEQFKRLNKMQSCDNLAGQKGYTCFPMRIFTCCLTVN